MLFLNSNGDRISLKHRQLMLTVDPRPASDAASNRHPLRSLLTDT